MPDLWTAAAVVWAAAAVAQGLGFWYERRTRNAGMVDAVWALGTGTAAVAAALIGDGPWWLRLAVGVAGGLWGFRLGIHLLRDRVLGKPEEGRYARMRAAMPGWDGWGFFVFFQVQATWIALFALPFLAVAGAPAPPLWAALLAAAVWLTGFAIESIADHQLARFRAAHPGALCDVGLWSISRHPNYLGEWLTWFAWPLLAWNLDGGAWLWLAPVLVFVFLRWLTGIPWTEARLAATRGAAWTDYCARTPCLFPRLWPRSTP